MFKGNQTKWPLSSFILLEPWTTLNHIKGWHDTTVCVSYRKWSDVIYDNTETIIMLIGGRTQNERTADHSTALCLITK
jgi:hypothetical protein